MSLQAAVKRAVIGCSGQATHPPLFGGVQVPELHVSVSCGDEVTVVLREGDGEDSAGHFVGGDDGAFLFRGRR